MQYYPKVCLRRELNPKHFHSMEPIDKNETYQRRAIVYTIREQRSLPLYLSHSY